MRAASSARPSEGAIGNASVLPVVSTRAGVAGSEEPEVILDSLLAPARRGQADAAVVHL
jgi:hypothetical protein